MPEAFALSLIYNRPIVQKIIFASIIQTNKWVKEAHNGLNSKTKVICMIVDLILQY
jgi:hypothetical protein